MANGIYTNLSEVSEDLHGMFESSKIRETNHLFDVLVNDGETKPSDIAVDNGVAVKVGAFTGDGLQTRVATIAKKGDAIAVTGTPAVVKNAVTKAGEQPFNFTNPAGKPAKAYEITSEDIFAVASYQFTEASKAACIVGAYVVVNEDGQWVAQAGAPAKTTYGFIGQVHSLSVGNYYTMVRIQTIKNAPIA